MKYFLITIHLLIIIILISFNIVLSQNVRFYLQIDDNDIVPIRKINDSTGKIFLESKNAKMNYLIQKYKPKEFKQAFPTVKTPWLKKVYFVVCENKEFGKELKSSFQKEIPLVEYLCEPQLTDYPPSNDYHNYQTNLDLINIKYAYDYYKKLPKIPISLTDTYFDKAHEDLNFLEIWGINDSTIKDAYHGTAVSGCIAAITDNNIGIASVAYDTPLFGSTKWANDNEVLLLAQSGFRVINCSWINSCSYNTIQNALYEEIRNIWDAVVVFGAGNNHCGNGEAFCYPASYDANLSVTAVTHGSNPDLHEQNPGDCESAYQHNAAVDICAPGYNVFTTDLMGDAGNPGNYRSCWGTSFAAPQVAATIGIIFSINPCLTANEAVEILLNTSNSNIYNIPENEPYLGLLGQGRLDVKAAVMAAAESATDYMKNMIFSNSQTITSNYAFKISNIIINSGTINFKTRKEIVFEGPFEIGVGAECIFNINPELVVDCN